jgi:hypothetical protein
MKLKRFKVFRLRTLTRLLNDIFSGPIIWVVDSTVKKGGYFKFESLPGYLEWIYNDIEELIKGYYDCYTFEDEKFLTYEEVFSDRCRICGERLLLVETRNLGICLDCLEKN